MTFRPSSGERMLPLFLTVVFAGLFIALGASFLKAGSVKNKILAYETGGCAALVGLGIYLNWLSWTTRIRIDGRGVDWKEGRDSVSLSWDQIQELGWRRNGKYLRVGLIEKSSQELRILPFVTPEIYRELQSRCGSLPPEVETELKLRD